MGMYIFKQELEATLEVFRSLLYNQDFSVPAKIIYRYSKNLMKSENGLCIIFDKGKMDYKVILTDYGKNGGLSPEGDFIISINKEEEDLLLELFNSSVYMDNNPENAGILNRIIPNLPEIHNLLYIPINKEKDTEGFIILINKPNGFNQEDISIAKKFSMITSISYSTNKTIDSLTKKINNYKQIIEQQFELIYRIKPDGLITYVNEGMCNFYNVNKSDIIGKNIYDILPMGQIHHIKKKLNQINPNKPIISRTFNLDSNDGEKHWFEFRYAAITDSDKNIVEYQAIGVKITNKNRIERLLKKRLRFIKFVNKISFEFINNTTTSNIDTLINKDLEFVSKYTNVERGYIFCIYENEGKIRLTNEWCKDGVIPHKGILDSVDIKDFQNFLTTLKEGKTITVNISDIKPCKENQPMIDVLTMLNIKSFINIPLIVDDELIGYIGFDSTQKEVKWSRSSVRAFNITGHIIASALKRYRSEKSLKEYTRKLEQTNEELEHFAYMVSHDLKTPLISIISGLKIINMKIEHTLDEEGKDIIQQSIKKAHSAADMVTELLSYTKINKDSSSFEVVDMEDVVFRVIDNVIRKEENNIIVNFNNMPVLKGSEKLLFGLFKNLLENAIKYCDEQTPRVDISAEKMNDKWLFSVQDNGIGIDPAYHDTIFQMFRRACDDDKYQGTGIGLAICKKIVKIHSGEIWLDSELGKGSTFYFTLPSVESNL
jgi:PAS domain S-box-containing protein